MAVLQAAKYITDVFDAAAFPNHCEFEADKSGWYRFHPNGATTDWTIKDRSQRVVAAFQTAWNVAAGGPTTAAVAAGASALQAAGAVTYTAGAGQIRQEVDVYLVATQRIAWSSTVAVAVEYRGPQLVHEHFGII